MEKIYKFKFELLALLLILIMFHLCYGISIVAPSNINWLMAAYHDWGAHYLGWAYFQHEPWHFPLGHIENYNYPSGTNIGFTDSIPLLAIFFKLFKFLLPDTFQYFGIWFLFCHVLAGYFTYKILKRHTSNLLLLLLSILLVSFCPVLIYRALHPALCAHWVLLASIYYYTQNADVNNVNLINKSQIVVLLLSALINPYLFLMVIGFNIILPFKLYFFDKLISLKRAIAYVIVPVIATLFAWYIIGMISFGAGDNSMEVENAYGLYGLNLNSFYNSGGYSSVLPSLPLYTGHQYEGYAYFGLGVFVLIFISMIYLPFKLISVKKNTIKHYFWFLPFVLLLTALSLFAISNQITLNDQLLFEYGLPDLILKIGNIFRASGRFVWVLYYTILLVTLICFIKLKISHTLKVLLLFFIVPLQFYDIKQFLTAKDYVYGDYKIKPLDEKKWESLSSNFERIITYPPFENTLAYAMDYQDWCYLALKNNLPITNGYAARASGDANLIFQQKIKKDIEEGIIDKNDFYVIAPNYIDDFSPLIYKQLVNLGYMDGYYYLYSKENTSLAYHKFKPLELHKADSIFKNIEKSNKLEPISTPYIEEDKIQFNIEKNTFSNDVIDIQGWAFLKNTFVNSMDSVVISLSNEKNSYVLKTSSIERPDVAAHFNNENLKQVGFKARGFTDKMEEGSYNMLVGIKTEENVIFQSTNQSMIEVKKEITPIAIKTLPYSVDNVSYNIEESYEDLEAIYINGWAFISEQSAVDSNIQIILESPKIVYSINVFNVQRPDVTSYFNQNVNYDNSGFKLRVDKQKLKKGNYKIGILITTNDESTLFKSTDKTVIIN